MYLKIVLSSLFILFMQHLARVIYNMDYHKVVYNHVPGPCRLVPGVEYGSEDMQTLSNGLAFITSGLLFPPSPKSVYKYHEEHNIKGKIFLFDFNHPENDPVVLKISKEFDQDTFYPHGISILEDKQSGGVILFVVNHPPGFDTIEKFQFIPEENLLQHIKTYIDPAIHFANDVLVTGENSFYFTNYGHFRGYWGHLMEITLELPFGNIMYFDGKDYKIAADGFLLPNGLAMSHDGKTVYAASSKTEDLKVFRRESDNTLELVQQVPVYSALDNPTVEPETGNILIGAHPVFYQVAEHLHHPEIPAPSQVLYLYTNSTNHVTFVTELYSDTGHTLYASTVASMYQKKMLLSPFKTALAASGIKKKNNVQRTLQAEMEGSGRVLGCRTMSHRLFPRHGISIGRDAVLRFQYLLDHDVDTRTRHCLARRVYFNKGPNYLVHVDGYDKIKIYGYGVHDALCG